MHVYRSASDKPMARFINELTQAAESKGFLIHNEDKMEMAHTFGRHGAEVAEGFDLHMIQICKPEKAAKSLSKNPERAVLMPKFVMAFSENGKTQIRFLHPARNTVRQLVDDEEFPASLDESIVQIIRIIEDAM